MLNFIRATLLGIAISAAHPSATHAQEDALVLLSPGLPGPAFPISDELREALTEREFEKATQLLKQVDAKSLKGPSASDHAFVLAWALIRADKHDAAKALLPKVEKAKTAPKDYLALTRSEIHLARGESLKAVKVLDTIPESSLLYSRARLVRARTYLKLNRSRDAHRIYKAMADRPDPAPGNEIALYAIAKKYGLKNAKSKPYLHRIWSHYPLTTQGKEAAKILNDSGFKPTTRQTLGRAEAFNRAGAWRSNIDLLTPLEKTLLTPSNDNCHLAYLLGRARFKKNEVTNAARVLGPMGRRCVQATPDRGPKMLYLSGKSEERKKQWAKASAHYLKIPALYPDHSYADDGYALGGIAAQEASNQKGARAAWKQQVEQYPDGDMAGEAYWRLAWGFYRDGNTPQAIEWAKKTVKNLPMAVDPVHYRAAKYWHARWHLYPDVRNPRRITKNKADRALALDELAGLVREHPHSYYGLLAAARLYELAPSRLNGIQRPSRQSALQAWKVRKRFADSPHIANGIALARLGLQREAISELRSHGIGELLPAEITLVARIRLAAGDKNGPHDLLRGFLTKRPPESLDTFATPMLRTAYPNRYFQEVKTAAKDYDWDPRIFHALVREESSFNPRIVSYAGARGLSQVMPKTAKHVAGWMKISYSRAKLFDPAYNLQLGTRYFEFLMDRFKNNPFLSMAGYNAGEGNVGKWRKRFGDLPTDEWVESIPIRQTRHYVKRVSASWQMYNYLYEQGPLYPDLSAYNSDVVP